MSTFNKTMLTLSLMALPLIALPGLADARRLVPKYRKTAITYRAQQAKKLTAKINSLSARRGQYRKGFRVTKKVTRPTKPAARTNIKSSTTRAYVSRSLHKQAGMNYYLRGQKVRVTNVKINDNRMMIKASGKWLGWTAKVNLKGGDSYNANGFVRQQLKGQPKGMGRVNIQSGTPAPGVIIR